MTAAFEHKMLHYKFGWKGFDFSKIERELNELGSEGWETVDTIHQNIGNGQTHEIAIILKRACS